MATSDPNKTEAPDENLMAVGPLIKRLRSSRIAEPDADAVEAVDELFPTGHERTDYIIRFTVLLALSSSIAAFGLLADSSAVVIGAMLVAPLMTPILATSAATVRALNRELLIALVIITLGSLLAIAVGYLVSLIAGDTIVGSTALPQEVEARTFPGLLDLCIAVTAGAAAGYILPRRSVTSALPGVGISVALVPPLAVVGITLEAGRAAESSNALLLYLTNLAAIVFAASFMLVLAGFRPKVRSSRRSVTARVIITLSAVVAVAVPLSLHTRSTLENAQLRSTVADAVLEWDETARIIDLVAEVEPDGTADIEVLVAGPNEPEQVWALAEDIHRRHDGPVELELRYAQDLSFTVSVR
jgi:uncharacterized hydrophobic protein (TIGR00271 family)